MIFLLLLSMICFPDGAIGSKVAWDAGKTHAFAVNTYNRYGLTNNNAAPSYPKAPSKLRGPFSSRTAPPSLIGMVALPRMHDSRIRQENTINGTLVYIRGNTPVPWNNVSIQLQKANAYFNGRYQSYRDAGYTHQQALSALIKEDNLWTTATDTLTKPAQLRSEKYGWSYSWFGYVNVGKGYFRVFVPGYRALTHWVSFTGEGQKISVALEYRPKSE